MAKQINTSIKINASKEKIWEILTDFEKYPEWNPFIISISGTLKVGKRLTIKLQGMSFNPVLLVVNRNVELKWLGHFWIKGLFDGAHKFLLTENIDGSINFEQSERFSGILVGFFSKSINKHTKDGFKKMNMELKLRAERLEN